MKLEQLLLDITSNNIKLGLQRTKKMLQICGAPQKKIKSIQVVGTNGKGSVSAYIASMLEKNNYKVGLFTSPHLVRFNERIQINSKAILNKDIKKFIKKFHNEIKNIEPSFFELLTTISMWYFLKKNVDIAVLETGLGGRLDSVTACQNNYIVFTSISKDHHQILGPTIQNIAKEKAGAIINKRQHCISIPQKKIVKNELEKHASRLKNKIKFIKKKHNQKEYKQINPRYLLGEHQKENAFLGIETIKMLRKHKIISFKTKNTIQILNKTKWPGRLQIIKKSPTVIFDVAHNNDSINVCRKYIAQKYQNKTKYLICGFENNKEVKKAIKRLSIHFKKVICVETKIRKSMKPEKIKSFISTHKDVTIEKNITKTINKTINNAKKNEIVFILGSHFLGPYVKRSFKNCFAIK